MAGWGITDEFSKEAMYGLDGTAGDFPMDTTIEGNIVHELGMWEKQSSMWFQAKTAKTRIHRNLFFNGPRAGINFNDGFGGGDEVSFNLVFNTCRESGDHGPINSWDRLPYLTTVRDGTPSLVPADRHIYGNFIVSNYDGGKGVDNDDGSSYYQIYRNFMVGGWMHKTNWGGRFKASYGNLGAYATMGAMMGNRQYSVSLDGFYNNTIIFSGAQTYAQVISWDLECEITHCFQQLGNNTVFSESADVSVQLTLQNSSAKPKPFTVSMQDWLDMGYDNGTALVHRQPEDEEIITWARALLAVDFFSEVLLV